MGDVTTVRIGDLTVTPPIVTETAIVMPVPAGLQAGVLGLQVIQQLQLGTPPLPHSGYESNVEALVLQPVIVPSSASDTEIQVGITPAVQPGQRVSLLLNQSTTPAPASPAAYIFSLAPVAVSSSTLTFAIANVLGGGTNYFIRVRVDGAESPLGLDPGSATFGPTVTIP
jgi:hypothetical protein